MKRLNTILFTLLLIVIVTNFILLLALYEVKKEVKQINLTLLKWELVE